MECEALRTDDEEREAAKIDFLTGISGHSWPAQTQIIENKNK
ncbi:hypothetical protein C7S14_5055 [Burkholderia cepacia]|nr:hypothetical protein [Burkholderia cepacia]QOH33072.1 hypothetical protein C7S14_5055 [Burkholderia cepacia]